MEENTHETVDRIERLYEAGDYRTARALAAKLAGDDRLEAGERDRIDRVLAATGTDKAVVAAIAFTLGVLVFLVLRYGF